MSEQTAAFRKVFEYELLEAETKVKYYRSLLGMPPVGSSTDCVKEIESLKSQLQEKTEENEVLHRKVHDLIHKLCQSRREYIKLCNELKAAKEKLSVYRSELDKARSENCTIFKVHLSDESEKIAELNKEVADLQKENRELCEQLKSKSILDTVCFQKYWKQQNALESCEKGEACEVELNNGAPFEKGYFLRLTKKEYELSQDGRLSTHVAFLKRSDK